MSRYGIHSLAKVMQQANEAAAFQYNANLFHDITAEIAKFRQDYKPSEFDTKNLRKTNLDTFIRKHTGMNVTTEINKRQDLNAFVLIPEINRGNNILAYFDNGAVGLTEKDIDVRLKEAKEGLVGEVDLKRGHVSGIYGQLAVSVHVTMGLMCSNLDASEVAAIILHELGHAFTFFESMNRLMRRNWILESRLKDFREAGDRKSKVRILDSMIAEKFLDRDFPKNEVVEAKDGKGEILVLTKSQSKLLSDPATLTYDNTAFESASDQFAVRMGAGRALATGLAKMYQNSRGAVYTGHFIWAVRQLLFFSRLSSIGLSFAVLGPLGGMIWTFFLGLGTISLGMSDHFFKRYDKPEDRIERIRKELITGLKDRTIPEEVRKDILDDYDRLETLYLENRSLMIKFRTAEEFLVEHCIPFCIANRNSKHYQQTLEALQNNDLYAAAVRFE